jgi:hypothetical protein
LGEKRDRWVPLNLREIEQKPKEISEDIGFYVADSIPDSHLRDLVAIRNRIRLGQDLGPFYRQSGDQKGDRLLVDRGIMHLHLGGPHSNSILYLVQFPEDVLFLCVDTHIHLEDIPPGKKLPDFPIRAFARRLQEKIETRASMLRASLRKFRAKEGE